MSTPDPRKHAREIFERLKEKHPDAHIELAYDSPLELLVATVLSAQCTDTRVNKVTKELFRKYHSPRDYLEAPVEELQDDIRSTGFFRRKAERLQEIMKRLLHTYGGRVPDTMQALTDLPGIGRKTANVILGNAFGKPGIAVDTHVKRVSRRIGLTEQNNPDKIEQDLAELFEPEQWVLLSHTLIFHGRYLCKARKPQCAECPVRRFCRYAREHGQAGTSGDGPPA